MYEIVVRWKLGNRFILNKAHNLERYLPVWKSCNLCTCQCFPPREGMVAGLPQAIKQFQKIGI